MYILLYKEINKNSLQGYQNKYIIGDKNEIHAFIDQFINGYYSKFEILFINCYKIGRPLLRHDMQEEIGIIPKIYSCKDCVYKNDCPENLNDIFKCKSFIINEGEKNG